LRSCYFWSRARRRRKRRKKNGGYLHRGIARRAFERRFSLADHMKVTSANVDNGMLHVDVVHEVPEAAKPRTIKIGTSSSIFASSSPSSSASSSPGSPLAKGSEAAIRGLLVCRCPCLARVSEIFEGILALGDALLGEANDDFGDDLDETALQGPGLDRPDKLAPLLKTPLDPVEHGMNDETFHVDKGAPRPAGDIGEFLSCDQFA
jgi:hypothetical protein